jgi:putative ABC transport system permease protein
MDTILQNIRFAIRQLKKYPGFTAIAILTLAVGIGANASIFSLVDQILLKKLPVADPDRLVMLKYAGSDTGHTDAYGGTGEMYFSYPMYRDLRDQNQVFDGMLAMFPAQVGVQWRNTPSLAKSELVSGNYFTILGVKPALGRLLAPADSATSGASALVVLNYRYWSQHFGEDPGVINQTLLVNGNPFTIIGVVQPGFDSVIGGRVPDIFVPITMKAQMTPQWDELEDRRSKWLNIIGRLKPGMSEAQAQAGITTLWKSLRAMELQSIPGKSQKFRENFVEKSYLTLLDASKGFSPLAETTRVPLLILLGMVCLLTLMATVNVGSLLLVRAAGRTREMSVRYSLGATRERVIGQLLAEGLALGLIGGALGVALSPFLSKALVSLLTDAGTGGAALSSTPDRNVLLFSLAISVVASVLFSLAPIVQFYKPKITAALKQQTGTGDVSHARLRRVIVGVQIGLSLVLLVGAGLFGRTLSNLKAADVGFVTDHLLTFQLDPRLAGYKPANVTGLYKRLYDTLSALPGVQSVGMTDDPVLAQSDSTFSITVPGYQAPEGERNSYEWERVNPLYFTTLKLPLVAGRVFTDEDTPDSTKVVVVNDNFVRRFFGTPQNALGRTFTVGKQDKPVQIVGVVKTAKHSNLHEEPSPIFYTPLFQETEPNAVAVYLRTTQAPEAAASSVRGAVASLDSKLVVDSLRSLNNQIDTTLSTERMLSFIAISFGSVSVFIAAIGLYGVLAFSIAQRTREIGVRMALGATRSRVVKLVLGEVLILSGCSVAISIPLSIGLSSFVRSQLFGVSYRDPGTLLLVVIAIGVVALAAAAVPARRAVRVQPITALRYE